MSEYVQTATNGRKYIVNCCERCGKITEGIHTCTPNLVIERLTAELARSYAYAKTLEQEVFDAETKENEATELWEKERCFSQDLIKQLTETRDLAEHWMIIAEQRRMELGECRKDAERLDWLIASGARVLQEDDGFYLFWHTSYRETQRQVSPRAAIDAAMEAKP